MAKAKLRGAGTLLAKKLSHNEQTNTVRFSSGAKAPVFITLWTAWLKPRPFKTDIRDNF